jgi:hypothetical protein
MTKNSQPSQDDSKGRPLAGLIDSKIHGLPVRHTEIFIPSADPAKRRSQFSPPRAARALSRMRFQKREKEPAARLRPFHATYRARVIAIMRALVAMLGCAAAQRRFALLDGYFVGEQKRSAFVIKLHQIHAPAEIVDLA